MKVQTDTVLVVFWSREEILLSNKTVFDSRWNCNYSKMIWSAEFER